MTANGEPSHRQTAGREWDAAGTSRQPHRLRVAGIVLCGGRSSRMGRPKYALPFGQETLLQRVVRILTPVVSPIVIVAAESQELPQLPGSVLVERDRIEYQGPLPALELGLRRLRPLADAAFATACDVPLLRPEFVRAIISRLGEHEIAVCRDEAYYHPLQAVYRTRLADPIRELLEQNEYRPRSLIERCDSRVLSTDELRSVDPQLMSLMNLNSPDDYSAALRLAGIPQPGERPPR